MEGIFTSNIDAYSERLIITNLTIDLIDIYPYDEFEGDYSFEFWIILHEEEGKGTEYSKYNGEPYLFDPPRKIFLRVVVYLLFSQHQKDGLK